MSKEDEKKKEDSNQNFNKDFEMTFNIFSTKLNQDSRKAKSRQNEDKSMMDSQHEDLLNHQRSGKIGKEPKNPLQANTEGSISKIMSDSYKQPRMRIDIHTMQEVDIRKLAIVAEDEEGTTTEEKKVVYMQYIRSFLFIFGIEKIQNLKEVQNDLRLNSINLKTSSDIKKTDEDAFLDWQMNKENNKSDIQDEELEKNARFVYIEQAELEKQIKSKIGEAKNKEAEFLWDKVLTLKKQHHYPEKEIARAQFRKVMNLYCPKLTEDEINELADELAGEPNGTTIKKDKVLKIQSEN